MNNLYNKILNEVLKVYDFDSWDDSDQIFKNNIKNSLMGDPEEIIKWLDKNYSLVVHYGPERSIGSLYRIGFKWDEVTEFITKLRDGTKGIWDPPSRNMDEWKIFTVKYIVASSILKYGEDLDSIASAINASNIGLTNWQRSECQPPRGGIRLIAWIKDYYKHTFGVGIQDYVYTLTIHKNE